MDRKQRTAFDLLDGEQIMTITARDSDFVAVSNFGRLWRVFLTLETGIKNHNKEYWWATLIPTTERHHNPDHVGSDGL